MTVGQGKVVPSSQIQVVSNLEGGLIKEILVAEGQQVQQGQQLLLLDDTRFRSDFKEREQQVLNLSATVQQLSASISSVEINGEFDDRNWRDNVKIFTNKLNYPEALVTEAPNLVARQRAEYIQGLNELRSQLSLIDQKVKQKQQDIIEAQARVSNLRQSYNFARKELEITKPLADEGVVPRVELLKLQRQVNDTRRDMTSTELKSLSSARRHVRSC
ncbi:ABC-type protease exporter membrane fusion protein (MFP) family component PrtE/AprE [Vibrio astriarenae]|nr:ABC-type protease exporter membrane fusion protein (MFP) family component PrtE/AprE [Vibrio sp. C7]